MKNLIVFYSLEGNTRFVADYISKQIEADVLELRPKKIYHKSGLKKYFWGGKSVIFKDKPELLHYDVNINDYENIFIGTPIWVGTYTPPYNTFFNMEKINNKNIYLFACHSGGSVEKFHKNIKEIISNNKFKGCIDFCNPLKNNKEEILEKIDNWIKDIFE